MACHTYGPLQPPTQSLAPGLTDKGIVQEEWLRTFLKRAYATDGARAGSGGRGRCRGSESRELQDLVRGGRPSERFGIRDQPARSDRGWLVIFVRLTRQSQGAFFSHTHIYSPRQARSTTEEKNWHGQNADRTAHYPTRSHSSGPRLQAAPKKGEGDSSGWHGYRVSAPLAGQDLRQRRIRFCLYREGAHVFRWGRDHRLRAGRARQRSTRHLKDRRAESPRNRPSPRGGSDRHPAAAQRITPGHRDSRRLHEVSSGRHSGRRSLFRQCRLRLA